MLKLYKIGKINCSLVVKIGNLDNRINHIYVITHANYKLYRFCSVCEAEWELRLPIAHFILYFIHSKWWSIQQMKCPFIWRSGKSWTKVQIHDSLGLKISVGINFGSDWKYSNRTNTLLVLFGKKKKVKSKNKQIMAPAL